MSWLDKPYRGQTSFNLPEMFNLNNKQTLIMGVVGITAVVGITYIFTHKYGNITRMPNRRE